MVLSSHIPQEDLETLKTVRFCWDEDTAAAWLVVKELGVREMEKKGPETWGMDGGWEEVVAVRVAQKTAVNHGDAHMIGSSIVRWQQLIPKVCWADKQPFSHGLLLWTWWLASGEGAGLWVRTVEIRAACMGPEMRGLVFHVCVLARRERVGQERVKLKIYWKLPLWFLEIFHLAIHFSPFWAVFVQC